MDPSFHSVFIAVWKQRHLLIQTSSCKSWGLMTSHPVMANYIFFPRCNGRPTSKHEHNDLAEENTICKMDAFTFNAQKSTAAGIASYLSPFWPIHFTDSWLGGRLQASVVSS